MTCANVGSLAAKDDPLSVDATNIPDNVKIEDLRTQNENLLRIIHQMRTDMEDLTAQLSQQPVAAAKSKSETGAPITPGEIVLNIEKLYRNCTTYPFFTTTYCSL